MVCKWVMWPPLQVIDFDPWARGAFFSLDAAVLQLPRLFGCWSTAVLMPHRPITMVFWHLVGNKVSVANGKAGVCCCRILRVLSASRCRTQIHTRWGLSTRNLRMEVRHSSLFGHQFSLGFSLCLCFSLGRPRTLCWALRREAVPRGAVNQVSSSISTDFTSFRC